MKPHAPLRDRLQRLAEYASQRADRTPREAEYRRQDAVVGAAVIALLGLAATVVLVFGGVS